MSFGTDAARYLTVSQSIAPAAITATTTGSAVDCTEAGTSVQVIIDVGVLTAADATNFMTFTVTQSATLAGSYTAPDAAQYDNINSWDRILNATTEGSAIYRFNFLLKPGYSFLKVVATETLTFNGIFGAAIAFVDMRQPAVAT